MPSSGKSKRPLSFEAAGDWPEAINIWSKLDNQRVLRRLVLIGLGRCNRAASNAAAADRFLSQAKEEYPNDLEILAEYAQVPDIVMDWAESSARWKEVFHLGRDAMVFAGVAAITYGKNGSIAEAEALLEKASLAVPDVRQLLVPKSNGRAIW